MLLLVDGSLSRAADGTQGGDGDRRLLHGELSAMERIIYPQLLRIADRVSRSALDRLRDFKTDVKALSQRIGRVRKVITALYCVTNIAEAILALWHQRKLAMRSSYVHALADCRGSAGR